MPVRKFVVIVLTVAFVLAMVVTAHAETPSAIKSNDDLQLVNVKSTVKRVSASDSNGFKAVILGMIGDYETVITDYTYSSGSGYTNHSISIERDYAWIWSCILFIVAVYCTFRIIGGMLCK